EYSYCIPRFLRYVLASEPLPRRGSDLVGSSANILFLTTLGIGFYTTGGPHAVALVSHAESPCRFPPLPPASLCRSPYRFRCRTRIGSGKGCGKEIGRA